MNNTPATSSPTRDCILILGMHRSGTSALSGTMSLLGYGLPTTLAPADHNNQRGYFESKALWDVNDDLLAEIGSDWDDWTPVDMAALPNGLYDRCLKRAIEGVQAEYQHCDGPFILKDPRMCRLVPLWLDALSQANISPYVIHVHRHPLEVAASLHRRDGYDPAFGLLMWLRHVLEAEHATRNVPRCFTSFNLLMQDWQKTAETIHQRLGLPLPPRKGSGEFPVGEFLSAGLRHFNMSASAELEDWWQNSLDILERWAVAGETPEDRNALDEIRSELAALPPQFAALVRPGQLAATGQDDRTLKLQEDIQELNRILEGQAQNLDRVRHNLAKKEAEMLKLQKDIRERDDALGTQTQTLDQLQANNMRLQDDVMRAEGDYQAMLQSSSWRLTAPLRNVSELLRRGPKSS